MNRIPIPPPPHPVAQLIANALHDARTGHRHELKVHVDVQAAQFATVLDVINGHAHVLGVTPFINGQFARIEVYRDALVYVVSGSNPDAAAVYRDHAVTSRISQSPVLMGARHA